MKHPVNIVCVKTGTKYIKKDVERLYKMVKRNCTLPFIFYCLTDNIFDLPEDVVGIKLDKELDLETYWWKICLFDLGWNETILYLDLDVIVQNNIDYIFSNVNSKNIKLLDISNMGIYYPYDGTHDNILLIPEVTINSSVMLFNPSKNQLVFDNFFNNPDYNIISYYGLDRFIQHNFKNLSYFDFKKDFYMRSKGVDFYDPKYVENNLIKDPTKTFCIMNQCNEEHYKGMEEYLL